MIKALETVLPQIDGIAVDINDLGEQENQTGAEIMQFLKSPPGPPVGVISPT